MNVVATDLPGINLAAHGLDTVDAPVQTLADYDVDHSLSLSHVQRAAVLGCVNKLEAVLQRFGLLGGKRLVQRARGVRIQVFHHRCDALGIKVSTAIEY